jgi:TolA-binding protein
MATASRIWRLLIALASTAGLAVSAEAQTVLGDPQQITYCLCQSRGVDELKAALDQQWRLYEEARQRYAALEGQVDTVRARMNVHDRDAVESFKRLLDERDAARLAFENQATPAYDAAVQRYDGALEAYNGSCAGRLFDQAVLAEVQRNLYCPR